MITHPATTTHGRLTELQKRESGIRPNMVRLSVGLEDVNDIIDDIDQAIAAVRTEVSETAAGKGPTGGIA